MKITTGQGGGDCGIDFVKGGNYLVYAHNSEMYGKKQLISVMCDKTKELTSVKEDLAYLGTGKIPTKQVDLSSEDRNRTILWVYLHYCFYV